MRLHHRCDPRWVALLLVPVLLAAGAAQPEPRVASATAVAPVALRLADPVRVTAPPAPGPARVETAAVVAGADVPLRRAERADRSGPVRRRAATVEERGRAALAALRYDDVAELGYRFRFLPYRGGGTLGTTNRRTRLITVHVPASELVLRATLAHELGHALDFEHGTAERRAAYRRTRALPPGPWFPCARCDDLGSPAGDFAEVFAVWLVGASDFRSRLQGPPDRAQLRELERLFRVPAPPRAAAEPTPSPQPTRPPDRGLAGLLGPAPSPSPSPSSTAGRR